MKELKFLSSGGALNLEMGSNCSFLNNSGKNGVIYCHTIII